MTLDTKNKKYELIARILKGATASLVAAALYNDNKLATTIILVIGGAANEVVNYLAAKNEG